MSRDETYWLRATNDHLEDLVAGLQYEVRQRDLRLAEKDRYIAQLEQQIQELQQAAAAPAATAPSWVKPKVVRHRRRSPGRAAGHPAALRPMPKKIDRHQTVSLPQDAAHKPICPHCRTRLVRLRRHRRIVEDLIRSTVETTCYHTRSGQCAHCGKRVESRSAEQPPAASLPHGQLGLNALATAAMLRVRHRLPYRQIAQLLQDLPGLSISAAGLVKQIRRLARWLDEKYQALLRRMRASPQVHVDETGWRIDGGNFWLWAFTDPTFTLYHVDESRGGKVPLRLLGKAFGGTVVADFYSAYHALGARKQRCLVHLLREVNELSAADSTFRRGNFGKRLKRWCQDALAHKKRWSSLKPAKYQLITARLDTRLSRLADTQQAHPDAQRLAQRLKRHRQELTRFLYEEHLEGTNNAAERALRPAVVFRKITGGHRSRSGANAWATLASLLRTADQQQLGVYDATKQLITDYWNTKRR